MVAMHIREELNSMLNDFKASGRGLLEVTSSDFATYEKGTYIVAVAKPSKRLASLLTVDREIAVLITSFTDLQARTLQVLRRAIDGSNGRLESTVAVVIHKDPRGNAKLANWGRESGLSTLPICFGDKLPTGTAF